MLLMKLFKRKRKFYHTLFLRSTIKCLICDSISCRFREMIVSMSYRNTIKHRYFKTEIIKAHKAH